MVLNNRLPKIVGEFTPCNLYYEKPVELNRLGRVSATKHSLKAQLLFLVTCLALFFMPVIISAQAPTLGEASTFAIFTIVGAIDNVGTTHITGDIGTDAGAFNGFPPGIIDGETHVADTVSAKVAAAVNRTYNYMVAMSCDTLIEGLLGSGQIFAAKGYCIAGAATLNGDLILDGQGDPDALFVFQINGAFTVSAASNVVLINSARMANIYWQVNGRFDLGANSVFQGTVIANGAMGIVAGSSLMGRAFTRQGAISLNNTVVDYGNPGTPLPINLLSFNAGYDNQLVFVKWSTAIETNNDYYSIENSTDGINWQVVGTVAGKGNSTTVSDYSFTHTEPYSGVSYYRLKQTDFDGAFEHFNIITVRNFSHDSGELDIYPNPAKGTIHLFFKGDERDVHSTSIYNLLGEEVYRSESYESAIDLSSKQQGNYFIYLKLATKIIIKKLMLER